MENDVYLREGGKGFSRQPGAEIVDRWEEGCLIRSERPLPAGPGNGFYVEDEGDLISVVFGNPDQSQGPFDYRATFDRADTRQFPRLVE